MILSTLIIFLIIFTILLIFLCLWKHLSNIYHRNYSFFDLFFIMLYFSEQAMFLLFYNLVEEQRELWVGLIVLIVVTTSSLDKLAMQSRYRRNSKVISKSIVEKNSLLNLIENQQKEINRLKEINKEIIEFIEKKIVKGKLKKVS